MTYDHTTHDSKDEVAAQVQNWVDEARDIAQEVGLDPYPVNYWIVSNDEMNRIATYGGFQTRYPHWRWGMKHDEQEKKSEHMGGRIFELVNNDNPAHAFLQRSNPESDQKAVVAHVEAHSDFFKNNRWFETDPNATQRLESNAERIEEIMERTDIERAEVEKLIDTVLCIEDTIDQHNRADIGDEDVSLEDHIEKMDIDDSIKEQMFDADWKESVMDDEGRSFHYDLVEFCMEHGARYDEEQERGVEFEDWEREVIEIIRDEAYYFAPQQMTKVMNEGWASYFQTIIMSNEGFADETEFLRHADMHSKVLSGGGFNPYSIGRNIWEFIENTENRTEVLDKLLRVDGITPGNFHRSVDFDRILGLLDHPDSFVPEKRNFSLVRPQNRGFLSDVTTDQLSAMYRYMIETDRYHSVEQAIEDVDYDAGWTRMREIRETHADPTFIGQFIDDEFIEHNDYFTYDYNPSTGQHEVSSTDPEEVKKKLLLQFTNFGKPTIAVEDDNYNNSGELLITHFYNGISLDLDQAKQVMERIFDDLWGRPVNLRTIVKTSTVEEDISGRLALGTTERDVETGEQGFEIRYDGEEFTETELDDEEVEYIKADAVDYDVRPEEWL